MQNVTPTQEVPIQVIATNQALDLLRMMGLPQVAQRIADGKVKASQALLGIEQAMFIKPKYRRMFNLCLEITQEVGA